MTVEEFYDEHYEDANHFYIYVRGIAIASPKKIQAAMEAYHEYKVKHLGEQLKCECKKPQFTRTVDEDYNPTCGECGRTL